MNRKVFALLAIALLVLVVGRATRHEVPKPAPTPALPVSSGHWTAARIGGAVAETGSYQGMTFTMTATPGSADVGLDVTGDPAKLPDDEQVEFHGTFDDHSSFALVGDGSSGDLESGLDPTQVASFTRHMAAGGSLVISFDDQSAAPVVFPLDGAPPTLRAWSAAAASPVLARETRQWDDTMGPDAAGAAAGFF